MKLYATVTSERASKGQGGNKCIHIELKAFNREYAIGNIVLEVMDDSNGKPKQWLLTYQPKDSDNQYILGEGHEEHGYIQGVDSEIKTKGKKQKDNPDDCISMLEIG